MNRSQNPNHQTFRQGKKRHRSGVITVLTAFLMFVLIGFLALGVEIGFISYQKQSMQNACDAAALAAAMEITAAIENAPSEIGDAASYAENEARKMAVKVAEFNGHFIDPSKDVQFGRRQYDASSDSYRITWNASPANVVKVICRKDNPDPSQPDAKVRTFFAKLTGNSAPALRTAAVSSVEPRDIVSVLDFSRSMNFDSTFTSEAAITPTESQIRDNLKKVWDDLGNRDFGKMPWEPTWVTIPSKTWGPDLVVRWEATQVYVEATVDLQRVILTYNDKNSQTFNTGGKVGTFQGTGGDAGKHIIKCECRIGKKSSEIFDFYNNADIQRGLGLSNVSYPWPAGSWDNYISMARDPKGYYAEPSMDTYGFRYKFGIMTFLHYVMRFNYSFKDTPELWKTRHYPFTSMKNGQELLCDYLEDLCFNDYVGMVSYDQSHRVETVLSGADMKAVDISKTPITNNYQAVRDLIHHKQAGHYSPSTNMGGGLKEAKNLLLTKGRSGAQPTIVLITDGQANTIDSGDKSNLPPNWDWDKLFDYDNNGVADYTYRDTDSNRRYVLARAKECVDAGITIHTISVGADADTALLKAVAHLGKGNFIECPAAATTEQFNDVVLNAFKKIASFVPPAKLLNPNSN